MELKKQIKAKAKHFRLLAERYEKLAESMDDNATHVDLEYLEIIENRQTKTGLKPFFQLLRRTINADPFLPSDLRIFLLSAVSAFVDKLPDDIQKKDELKPAIDALLRELGLKSGGSLSDVSSATVVGHFKTLQDKANSNNGPMDKKVSTDKISKEVAAHFNIGGGTVIKYLGEEEKQESKSYKMEQEKEFRDALEGLVGKDKIDDYFYDNT